MVACGLTDVLWWAASKGRTEVLEVLLAHGANVEAPDKVRVDLPAKPVPVTPAAINRFKIQN